MLRDEALSDPRVIDFINARLAPVWVDTRKSPVPDLPALDPQQIEVKVDERRCIDDGFSRSFLVRSAVVSPDGRRLLNPDTCRGGLPITKPEPYLEMLRRACEGN